MDTIELLTKKIDENEKNMVNMASIIYKLKVKNNELKEKNNELKEQNIGLKEQNNGLKEINNKLNEQNDNFENCLCVVS